MTSLLHLSTLSQLRYHKKVVPFETTTKEPQKIITTLNTSFNSNKGLNFFLTFFDKAGQDLNLPSTPNINDLPDGETIYYAKEHVPLWWTTTLLQSKLPDWAENTVSMAWLSDLDDLNVKWRVVLESWPDVEKSLPDVVSKAVESLFHNCGRPTTRMSQTCPSLTEEIAFAQSMVNRGSVLNNATEAYIPNNIVAFLPAIHQSILDIGRRASLHEASELEFTRKIYSRLLDPFLDVKSDMDHVSSQVSGHASSSDDVSRPDFRVDVLLSYSLRITIAVTEDAAEAMKVSPTDHKDWKKLIQVLRKSLSYTIKTIGIPASKARVYGFLFGGLTFSAVTMRATEYTSEDGLPQLGFFVAASPVRHFTDSRDITIFFKILAAIYNYGKQISPSDISQKDWGSSEKLVKRARKPPQSAIKNNKNHYFPLGSFFPVVTKKKTNKRTHVQDDDEEDDEQEEE